MSSNLLSHHYHSPLVSSPLLTLLQWHAVLEPLDLHGLVSDGDQAALEVQRLSLGGVHVPDRLGEHRRLAGHLLLARRLLRLLLQVAQLGQRLLVQCALVDGALGCG